MHFFNDLLQAGLSFIILGHMDANGQHTQTGYIQSTATEANIYAKKRQTDVKGPYSFFASSDRPRSFSAIARQMGW